MEDPMQYLETTALFFYRIWNNFDQMNTLLQHDDGRIQVEKVLLIDGYDSGFEAEGTLHLTTSHLIFVDLTSRREKWVLLSMIQSLEKQNLSLKGSPLIIRCKTFETLKFILPRDKDCQDVYLTLQKLTRPDRMESLYCFHFKPPNTDKPLNYGWDIFNVADDYTRMGIGPEHKLWRRSDINSNYQVCDTYPSVLYFPNFEMAGIRKHVLRASANFRSRGRLPALSYLFKGKSALCRCSQPLAGFSARCVEDEQLLQAILRVNPGTSVLHVVDTRPMVNALANRVKGKGYENEQVYKNIHFQFFDIDHIHVMRGSLEKLLKVCETSDVNMSSYLAGVERSGWLRHIRNVLDAAWFVANTMYKGNSVLVHCSDGWDRTAQTCSLAQIMLDPFYRTIVGFQAVIHKEWLSFGHKFTDRCGILSGHVDASEQSPIFTQFLDCVWQLMQQRPQAFQFDERLLKFLHDQAHAAQYGTFVGNCEKDRLDLKLSSRTASLWGALASRVDEFLNPLYRPESMPGILEPNPSPQSIRVWTGLYCRWEGGSSANASLRPLLTSPRAHTTCLRSHLRLLQLRVRQLCLMLGKSESETMEKASGLARPESLYTLKDLDCGDVPGKSGEELMEHMVRPNREEEEESGFAGSELDSSSSVSDSCFTPAGNGVEEAVGDLTCQRLVLEHNSVAVDWSSVRAAFRCKKCESAFEDADVKRHCWSCGHIYCISCVPQGSNSLPGLLHSSSSSSCASSVNQMNTVCQACSKEVSRGIASLQRVQ